MPETCTWDPDKHQLKGNVGGKVRQFLREGLIKQVSSDVFRVSPAGGRKITHIVDLTHGSCTCQRFRLKGECCSHLEACKLYVYQMEQGGRE